MPLSVNNMINCFLIPSNNRGSKFQSSKENQQQPNHVAEDRSSLLCYKKYQNMTQWDCQNTKLIRNIHAKAEHGDREAQYKLGCMYLTGNQVEKNIEEAMGWLKCAAKHDHVQAQYSLSWLYGTGCDDVIKNEQEALFWLRKATSHQTYVCKNI